LQLPVKLKKMLPISSVLEESATDSTSVIDLEAAAAAASKDDDGAAMPSSYSLLLWSSVFPDLCDFDSSASHGV
jgi:hypothetical protein